MKAIGVLFGLCLALLPACGKDDSVQEPESRDLMDSPAAEFDATHRALEIPEDSPTVVFVGDSIGAGLHLAEEQAFPALLQARLATSGLPFHLINASESGRTSAGGATAISWVLRSEPDVVVVELGGNDGLRGISLEQTESNLRAIITESQKSGARVLLLGVRLPLNYGEYGADFDALYPKLASELELAFVPYFMEGVGGVPEMNLDDGLHPTAAGHARLAENVEPALRELLDAL